MSERWSLKVSGVGVCCFSRWLMEGVVGVVLGSSSLGDERTVGKVVAANDEASLMMGDVVMMRGEDGEDERGGGTYGGWCYGLLFLGVIDGASGGGDGGTGSGMGCTVVMGKLARVVMIWAPLVVMERRVVAILLAWTTVDGLWVVMVCGDD
ncbi:hypothetical protein Dimus_005456, partial [Dionaea muscipula]